MQIRQNKPLQARSTFTHAQTPVLAEQLLFITQVWWFESCIEPVKESSGTKCVVKWDKVSLYVFFYFLFLGLILTQRLHTYSIHHHRHQPWSWICVLWLYPDFTAGMKHQVWHHKAGLHVFAVHVLIIRCTTISRTSAFKLGFPNVVRSADFVVLWIWLLRKILPRFQIIAYEKTNWLV